jgi:hypothetical protein
VNGAKIRAVWDALLPWRARGFARGFGCVERRPDGPKGQESIAQGLPWVSQKNVLALKGQDLEMPTLSVGSGFSSYRTAPSGLIPVGDQTQGKPWAKLSWPLRAMDRKAPNCRALRDEESSQTALNFVPFSPVFSPGVNGAKLSNDCRPEGA